MGMPDEGQATVLPAPTKVILLLLLLVVEATRDMAAFCNCGGGRIAAFLL